ncbi:hypothetical protein [Comamonas jiangduensis]|uniref:hypothetical protein n=1 Tax=Comamonas jiangduensis TaxID=1194168 RepID=UPI003BF8D6CB
MNNQLVKERARYLYTISGQPYRAARPATPGYWRRREEDQYVKVPVRWYQRPADGLGAIVVEAYWFDPYSGRNESWAGIIPAGQTLQIPFGLGVVKAPPKVTQTYVPGTPYEPEQPYIPDQHVYEDSNGWNAGARSIARVGQGAAVSWKVSPTARGVAVGLAPNATAGAYWQYPIGVLAVSGAAKVIAAGAEVQSLGIFTANTVFRIERLDGIVGVYVDDVLRYTAPDTTTAPLLLDVSLYASGDSMHDPAITSAGSGVAHGVLPGLQGLALGDTGLDLGDEEDGSGNVTVKGGMVALQAAALVFSTEADQGEYDGNGEAHGTLAGLYGIAADAAGYAFTSGALPDLQGEARGFLDLPPLESPTYIHAVMPSMSAADAPVSVGVQSARMAWLVGVASDDDVAQAYGFLPLGSISAEGENPDEDTLHIQSRSIAALRSQSVQEARLREQLSALMTLGASHISLAPIATHVRATEGMASSSTTSAGVHALARLVSGAPLSQPHQDDDAVTQVCHEKGGFVTHYSSYNFDAFAQIGGHYYGVAADGVYLLEGESDEGRAITARIDFGTQKLSSAELKSIPAVYAGMASTAAATLVVGTRQGEYRYVQRGHAPRLQTQRFDLGRGLRDTHYDFALEVPAAGLELDNMEFGATKSTRRI